MWMTPRYSVVDSFRRIVNIKNSSSAPPTFYKPQFYMELKVIFVGSNVNVHVNPVMF